MDMSFAWLSFSAFIKKALSFKDLGLNMKLMEYAGVCTVINVYIYILYIYVNICINVVHV